MISYNCVHNVTYSMKVETENLKTVRNYAKKIKRNRSRIYQLVNEEKIDYVTIDGVTFIKDEKK